MFFDTNPARLLLVGFVSAAFCIAALASFFVVEAHQMDVMRSENFFLRIGADIGYFARFKLANVSLFASALAAPHSESGSPAATSTASIIPVLLYHGEGPVSDMPTSVFIAQLRALKEDGWSTITMEQFQSFMEGKITLPAKSFLLTFDDGRRDTFYAADPVLKDLGYNAVMFVITGLSLPNNGNRSVNDFYLSKTELAYMASSGRWELESHGNEDHRGYDIPSATSTGSALSVTPSQHFLSNLFWVPAQSRLETPAEFDARVTNDLITSKNLLEENFGTPVIGYAYPFNDFGQDTINYPESVDALARIVPSLYQYAFYQTWPGNGDTFNYPDSSGYLVKRIEPPPSWTGADLVGALKSGMAKSLPYPATSFSYGWLANWGDITPSMHTLALSAPSGITGAAAFLDGSESWRDYALTATANVSVGTISLIARHTGINSSYPVCAFSNDTIYLERHVGETQVTVAHEAYVPPAGTRSIHMEVTGAYVSCSSSGVSVTGPVADISPRGGAGVSLWDPTPGTANADITSFSAAPL
jgi:peptidoglycan/xylan/chitin deacetylase (PgdA/CDA1 family)